MSSGIRTLDPDKIPLGITPTLWWNDDFPLIDIGIPFEQCISEMALAGFQGCSVGHKYPTDPAVLKPALELRGLRVSEPWVSTYFTITSMRKQTPNMVQDVTRFLEGVSSSQVGVCVDSAHVVLGSDGPAEFNSGINSLIKTGRLKYVHISAPDRGAVKNSWIPWKPFLTPILEGYDGLLLVEVFNAIPVFLSSLRLTRRKFQIPGEDHIDGSRPDAYTIAREAIDTVRQQIDLTIGTADVY